MGTQVGVTSSQRRSSRASGYVALAGSGAVILGGLLPWWTITVREGIESFLPPGLSLGIDLLGNFGESYSGLTHGYFAIPGVIGAVSLLAALVLLRTTRVGLVPRLVLLLTGALTVLLTVYVIYVVEELPLEVHLAVNGNLPSGGLPDEANEAAEGTVGAGIYVMLVGGAVVALSALLPRSRDRS